MEWIVGGLLIATAVIGGAIAIWARRSDAIGWAVVQLVLVAGAGAVALLWPTTAPASTVPLAICTVLAATFGGGIVVTTVLRLAGHPMTAEDDLPASAWIGMAERFAMTFALAIGQGGIAAVVIAVKALGTYRGGSGTNRVASLRVLGTLISVIWALLCFGVMVAAQQRMAS
ncbi:MAG: hypothetical protein ABUT11_05270 [Leifsonia sp.]